MSEITPEQNTNQITLVILESLLWVALSIARSRLLTQLHLPRVPPFTLYLGLRGKPTSTTPDS